MAEVIAGTAVLGGAGAAVNWVNTLWSYNRENWSFDRGQEQAAMHQQQGMRISRYTQYREDIRDLFELSISKIGVYLTVATLKLGFVISLFYDGRLPQENTSYFDPSPAWLASLYGLALSTAGCFLIISIYMSITAAIQAQSFCVRVLTQHLRLPVPTDEDVMSCASRYKEFESSGSQMRIPYVATAGRKMYENIKRTLRGDTDDEDEEEERYLRPGPTQGPQTTMGALPSPETGNSSELRNRKYKILNERGEEKEIFTHRFMQVNPGNHAALGPPQLVVEDRCGNIVPVKRLPHIRLFRHIQGMWQPFDAYARVSMVLGTVSICTALCQFGNIWYLRALNEHLFAFIFSITWTVAALVVVFLEISFNSTMEKILVSFFLAGASAFSFLGAWSDQMIIQQIINGTDDAHLYWSLKTGRYWTTGLGVAAHVCYFGWIICFGLASRPVNMPGFIKHLPHRFRNIRVIDVFAPMNNQLKKAMRSRLIHENPANKQKEPLFGSTAGGGTYSHDDISMNTHAYNPEVELHFRQSISRAVELREHITSTMGRLSNNPTLRTNKQFAQLAERFQREWEKLNNLIPRGFSYSRMPAVGLNSQLIQGDQFDNVSTKAFSGQQIERIHNELEKQIQMFSTMVAQLDRELKEGKAEDHRKEKRGVFGAKKEKREGVLLMEERDSRLPFGMIGAGRARKFMGIDKGGGGGADDEEGEDDEDEDLHALSIAKRAPWDPPRAHIIFSSVMITMSLVYGATLGWAVYKAATNEFASLPDSNFNPKNMDLQDKLRGKTAPKPSNQAPALDSKKPASNARRQLLGNVEDWRKNPQNHGLLVHCGDQHAYFHSPMDYSLGPLDPSSSSTSSSSRQGYLQAPTCGNNIYDAMAVAEGVVYMSHFDESERQNYIVRCGRRDSGLDEPEPIYRLPQTLNGKIIAMDFETPHESLLAALPDGRFVVINRSNGKWVAERVIGRLEGLSQISVEPKDEEEELKRQQLGSNAPERLELSRRLLLIANGSVYFASFTPTGSNGGRDLRSIEADERPQKHPGFNFPVKSIKFCLPSKSAGADTATLGEERRKLAVQIEHRWWITSEA